MTMVQYGRIVEPPGFNLASNQIPRRAVDMTDKQILLGSKLPQQQGYWREWNRFIHCRTWLTAQVSPLQLLDHTGYGCMSML